MFVKGLQAGGTSYFYFMFTHKKSNSAVTSVGLVISLHNADDPCVWISGSTGYCYSGLYVIWYRAAGSVAQIFLNDPALLWCIGFSNRVSGFSFTI